jgi:hypothetical protein
VRFRTCSYEKELTQALKDGHWPQGCGLKLRTHVDACGNCSDLVLVTQTFLHARSESEHSKTCESPSLLWWRAQLCRRNAATERVSRPIKMAQIFAWLVTVLGVVFVASQYRYGLHWAWWWSELMPTRAFHHLFSVGTGRVDWNPLLWTSSFGVLALLSALVAYLASEKS